ncbi:winged helix-turn-helix transcriptional regulator [Candidatus Pacearchaeota archaeon]|nr:winged helix-turn-helix transcriptional regulator [Candidatus Pacearchaeota archaeon]
MENKKLGVLLIIISLVFGIFIIYFNVNLSGESEKLGCTPNQECKGVENLLTMTNVGFGFFGFMLALGFYFLFFNKTEEKILKRLEDEKNAKLEEEKFSYIIKALDDYEKKVLTLVREQEGITQNTLRLRANLSKAKLSYVLQELEKRNLVKRIPKGKTLEVHLKI